MGRTSNSNLNIYNLQNRSTKERYQDVGCCALVKKYTSYRTYILESYFDISDTIYKVEQIREYLDLLIALGIPYTYKIEGDRVTIEFATDKLIHQQEGYVYFILIRYLWSNSYDGIVSTALDIVHTTEFDIFQAIQIAHHAKIYASGHSLYHQNSGCGYIYTYQEFLTKINTVTEGNLNRFFSRQYNAYLYSQEPGQSAYRKLSGDKQQKLVAHFRKRFNLEEVGVLIKEKKYNEAYAYIMEENNKYFAEPNAYVSKTLSNEMLKYIAEELEIPVKIIYEKCLDYVKTLDLTKMLGIKSNNAELDMKSGVGDLIVCSDGDNVLVGIKHKPTIIKVLHSSKTAGLSSCGWFKGSEGRLLPADTICWKLKVELDENY